MQGRGDTTKCNTARQTAETPANDFDGCVPQFQTHPLWGGGGFRPTSKLPSCKWPFRPNATDAGKCTTVVSLTGGKPFQCLCPMKCLLQDFCSSVGAHLSSNPPRHLHWGEREQSSRGVTLLSLPLKSKPTNSTEMDGQRT